MWILPKQLLTSHSAPGMEEEQIVEDWENIYGELED